MDYATARLNMVESQIRPNRVKDPLILAAMADLPREAFVGKLETSAAYGDEPVPYAEGRFLIKPLTLARLLQAAEILSSDVVLDIGCGTGYGAAILDSMASTVVALEADKKLAKMATEKLAELAIDSVAVVEGPLDAGYPKQAPYNVIFVEGAVAEIPAAILDQLSDNGRLVAIVGGGEPENAMGKAVLVTRHGDVFSQREIFDASAPYLPGFTREPAFEF